VARGHPGLAAVGVDLRAQYIYDIGGGPVWHTRSIQHTELEREQRRWAVRLDTTPGNRSDWLFEREWRVPVSVEKPFLEIDSNNVVGVLIGEPNWQPTPRLVPTGVFIDGSTGEYAYPGDLYAQPQLVPGLPPLWEAMNVRVYWNPATETFVDARA
jgi:hypothetical protein